MFALAPTAAVDEVVAAELHLISSPTATACGTPLADGMAGIRPNPGPLATVIATIACPACVTAWSPS